MVRTAVTGSDTSSNSLFGLLQVTAAHQSGMSEVLLAWANAAGGVLGKMISPSQLALGAATVGWSGPNANSSERCCGSTPPAVRLGTFRFVSSAARSWRSG
jgi:L-lactate permease